jgi:hypothetical protein
MKIQDANPLTAFYLQSSHSSCDCCVGCVSDTSGIAGYPSTPFDGFAGAKVDVDFDASPTSVALPFSSPSPLLSFPSLSLLNLRSICPISLPGSITFRTRFFSSFVSGNPPSVLRSQRRVSVGSVEVEGERRVDSDGSERRVDSDEVEKRVDSDEVEWRMVTVKIPPVTGTRAMPPRVVEKVWRSSCAN